MSADDVNNVVEEVVCTEADRFLDVEGTDDECGRHAQESILDK